MKDLSQNNFEQVYRSKASNVIEDFYLPCLQNSKKYYRAVGFFRSSVFLIIGPQIIDFVKEGGKIYLVCSPDMTQEDIESIEKGRKDAKEYIEYLIDKDINFLIKDSEKNYNHKVLATLIKIGALQIKIAILNSQSRGIYHDKVGIFEDDLNNHVSFTGSANESWSAWNAEGNSENIDVFRSWDNPSEFRRTQTHKEHFLELWRGEAKGIQTEDFSDAINRKLLKIAENDLNEIDIKKIQRIVLLKQQKKIDNLFKHQQEAINNWIIGGKRGIFEHATGSGKTVTALSVIDNHTKQNYPALVLVPSKLLLRQWENEINDEIEDAIILKAGDSNNRWKKNNLLHNFITAEDSRKRIVIAIMQTASKDDFIKSIRKVRNLLIIADEVHQVGSPQNAKCLNIDADYRLGLSATPVRYNDEDGTNKILNYFNGIIEPKFTLYDAIKDGRLTEYNYHPHLINLTIEEAEEWASITKNIKKEIAKTNNENQSFILSDKAKRLLILRSRIAKKSRSKAELVKKVMQNYYKSDQKWLIYCEDKEQVRQVTDILNVLKIQFLEYFTEMESDNDAVLKIYRNNPGVLVSIKCLDEGVDIPSISHALILASSQNPRQFIQRRGRVLRVHKSKFNAEIHDAIVIPSSIENEPDQESLFKSEYRRSFEFAEYSLNKSAINILKKRAIDLGIDLDYIEANNLNYVEDENE